jgi:hypothetical protein
MDVAALWRSLRTDPAKAPHIGAHQATAGEGIAIDIAQTCQVALPPRQNLIPEVSVTITSNRPGVAGDYWGQPQQPGRQLSGSHDDCRPRPVYGHGLGRPHRIRHPTVRLARSGRRG